jgi:hypothetical protein
VNTKQSHFLCIGHKIKITASVDPDENARSCPVYRKKKQLKNTVRHKKICGCLSICYVQDILRRKYIAVNIWDSLSYGTMFLSGCIVKKMEIYRRKENYTMQKTGERLSKNKKQYTIPYCSTILSRK